MSNRDGDGPITLGAAKVLAKAVLEKPEHQPKANDPRDKATRDDDLADPAHQEED